ncbi:MAG: BatD family protein [Steroidobacteraceae bacterium]
MKRWSRGAALLLTLLTSMPAGAALKAWLDHSAVAPEDTVQLTLELEGQARGQPDLAPLKHDFDILGTQSSSNIEVINGNTSAATEVIATLSPRHAGNLTVPGITWDGNSSPALALRVAATPANNGTSTGAGQNRSARLSLEATVDDKQPYVQAAVHVTVRLYSAETLYHAGLALPASGDALVQQVGADQGSTAQRDGQTYDVLTREYVVFPQHSGTISLPGPVLTAEVARTDQSGPFGADPFAGLFGKSPFGAMLTATKPVRVHGQPIVLAVRPRPAAMGSSYWLPARKITMTGRWQPDHTQVRVGDPVTVDLQVHAEGLTAAQLPDLAGLLRVPQGLKEYPDQAKLANEVQGDTVVGNREQSIALIADEPGQFTIPPLHLSWWDTRAGEARETTLPGRTLAILPAAATATAQSASATTYAPATVRPPVGSRVSATVPPRPAPSRAIGSHTSSESWWHAIALIIGLLWLVTLGAWFITHRRSLPSQPLPREDVQRSRLTSANARALFREACRTNDAPAARSHLLAWAGAAWEGKAPTGLNELARAMEDPSLSASLRELDRACYGGGSWQGEKLANSLTELPTQGRRSKGRRRDQLAPLYY